MVFLFLTERELAEITAVVVADYNSRGHRPQSGISPLQFFRQYADTEGKIIRKIDPAQRNRLGIFVRRFTARFVEMSVRELVLISILNPQDTRAQDSER